jgi:hypothetical protein
MATRSDVQRVGRWDFEIDSADWTNGPRYHTFDTIFDTEFKSSFWHSSRPHEIGRDSDLLRFHWQDLLHVLLNVKVCLPSFESNAE